MNSRILPILLMLLVLTGCGGKEMKNTYQQISQEEAKKKMDTQEVIVLDVREQDEFDAGHIPGAVLLPVGTVSGETAAAVIPRWCWCTVAAETAAERRPVPWQNWATQISTSSAASIPGPMR